MEKNSDEANDRIAWYPAFRSAIRLEFEDYQDVLEFKFENELNDEPLRIDAVIVKKIRDAPIRKDIAAMEQTAQLAGLDLEKVIALT